MLDLVNTVIKFLQNNSEKKFTAREIANWILTTYPDKCLEKQKRSTAKVNPLDNEQDLLSQIVAEIGAQRPSIQKRCPQVKTTEGRPRKYYFTESTDSSEIDDVEGNKMSYVSKKNISNESCATSKSNMKEKELYPILSEFLWLEFHLYSKRINENRSHNCRGKGGNKFLYPDIVGMTDLSREWHNEIKGCVKQYADKRTKLWSFEVKILINRSNVREVFDQMCEKYFFKQ